MGVFDTITRTSYQVRINSSIQPPPDLFSRKSQPKLYLKSSATELLTTETLL